MDREILREYLRCIVRDCGLSIDCAKEIADRFMGASEKDQARAVEAWRKARAAELQGQITSLLEQARAVESILKQIA